MQVDVGLKKAGLLVTVFCLVFGFPAVASDCDTLYKEKDYADALPYCIKEKKFFRTGWIYGSLDDCPNMQKYYRLSNSLSAKGNLGINLMFGSRGCEKNVSEGVEYLKKAVSGGSQAFATILGDHYRALNNNELAEQYFKTALSADAYSDWNKTKVNSAYSSLMSMLTLDQKIKFFLNGSMGNKIKCKMGADLSSKQFTPLLTKLTESV